ncbi:heavy-metal-associated domain-containing protein [Falsiroseomonas sp. E2-1-a20]|uniref:heavy-metal-associated domain-containing protein n=1 Tax=Falsiroseomonas sp. E2-1-a20 TaxID=3239300 RepID=UPI003F2AD783
MQDFDIPDVSCGHCVRTITQAVKALDPTAEVKADLATRRLRVASTTDATSLSAAITAAGYANTTRG